MVTPPKSTAHETIEERMLHRALFFTDGVFAIVLTIMVLELHPPPFDNPLGKVAAMRGMAGHLFAFALSFAVTGIFWLAHLNTVRRLIHFDWAATVANLAFLFPVCLIPFATAWYGRSYDIPFSWGFYCSLMVLISLGNIGLVLVVSRDGGRLVGGATAAEVRFRLARAAIPGVAFLVGLGLVLAGQTYVSQACWMIIPPLGLLIGRTMKPKVA